MLSYSSSDNFLSLIPVSDWLIFYCATLILYQKKEMQMTKIKIFDEKQQQQ